MPYKIHPIRLPLPFHLGSVNCYLVETASGYVLIDTGGSNGRAELLRRLEDAGCTPGKLRLVVLTHGDFDHSGNAAYLRQAFSTLVALHPSDSVMVERGNMLAARRRGSTALGGVTAALFGFGRSARFTPDVALEDGFPLSAFGFDARALWLPGHSAGSVGVLTPTGDLFCGDLLLNSAKPALNRLIDDPEMADASLARLESLEISTVYPGHGDPFAIDQFFQGD